MIHFFLHIPKSAGMSLRDMVARQYSQEQLVLVYDGQLDLGRADAAFIDEVLARICKIRAVFGHYAYGAHLLADLEDVVYNCMLRDPAARIASFFHHQMREEGSHLHDLIHSGMSLRTAIEKRMAPEFNNYATRILATDVALINCCVGKSHLSLKRWSDLWVSLGYLNGALHGKEGPYDQIFHHSHLDRAVRNIQQSFCFVGITERFTDSARLLFDGLGWTFRKQDVTVVNQTTDAAISLDSITLDAIREYNALDYELYERFADLSFQNFP
jgi:hypothetical protein